MDYFFDRCGFPYVALPALGLTVALLPLMRLQLGACLGDDNGPAADLAGVPAHAALLARNLRTSPLPLDDTDCKGLIATDLLPADAAAVAAWLIPGGRLPSVQPLRRGWFSRAGSAFRASSKSLRADVRLMSFAFLLMVHHDH